MSTIETLAVIPARLKSTRLPEKPLLKLCGRELVLRVLEGVRKSEGVDRVIVATDDERIASVVGDAGGEAVMTPADLPTGSDRVAWVARQIPSRFVINVQGDDPMVTPEAIDPLIETLKKGCDIKLAVLAKRIDDPREVVRDSIVKMVFDQNHRALYFSRSPHSISSQPRSDILQTHRSLRMGEKDASCVRILAADPLGEIGELGDAAAFGERVRHKMHRNSNGEHRDRHPGGCGGLRALIENLE